MVRVYVRLIRNGYMKIDDVLSDGKLQSGITAN